MNHKIPDNLDHLSAIEKRELLKKMQQQMKEDAEKQSTMGLTKSQFEFPGEYQQMKENFTALGELDIQNIYFNISDGINNNLTQIDGKEFINYSSYNYLGMSGDPVVSKAAKDAIDQYGTSVSASRIASGERQLHKDLEKEISDLLKTEASMVFNGGFLTNENIIGHICKPGDLILYDSFIHASIQQGAKLSGAKIKAFPHGSWEALEQILKEVRKDYHQVLIVIEGVYSMDGDIPDLPRFIDIKKRYQCMMLVDEAHSIGVLGNSGGGIREYHNIDAMDVEFWMGTLSKSFASCGGYISSSHEIIEFLKYTTPGFVFSVGISPPDTASALASIRLMKKEPERVRQITTNSNLFLELAKQKGLNTGTSKNSSVVPIIVGQTLGCIQLYKGLYEQGIFALPVIYPAVPENASRIRFFISSTHTEEQIRLTINHLSTLMS